MTALSARLADAKGERSIDSIRDQAEREGHEIDRATIAKYVAGQHGPRPPEKTLQALATGLGVDVRELRRLASMPGGELGPYVPVSEAARLDRSQRQALDALIKTIVKEVSDAGQAEDQKTEDQSGNPVATNLSLQGKATSGEGADWTDGHRPGAHGVEGDSGEQEDRDVQPTE